MSTMSLEQCQRWLTSLQDAGKWGWLPEHRKIGKHIRTQTRKRIKAHQTPGGRPWPKRYIPQGNVAIGDRGPLEPPQRSNLWRSAAWTKILTGEQQSRAQKVLKKMLIERYGANQAAVYRTGKRGRATRLQQALTRDRAPGSATRFGKTWLQYGLTPGWSKWAGLLDKGGTYNGKRVPPRTLIGLTQADLKIIENIYAAGYLKRVLKGAK